MKVKSSPAAKLRKILIIGVLSYIGKQFKAGLAKQKGK